MRRFNSTTITVLLTIVIICANEEANNASIVRGRCAEKSACLDTLSTENVRRYIEEIGIKYPKIAYQQMVLETGTLKSKSCKERNNLFGMFFARLRKTTAINKKKGLAIYDHWKRSVEDYKLWQEKCYVDSVDYSRKDTIIYKRGIDSEKNYYAFLNRKYAQDSAYAQKLKKI